MENSDLNKIPCLSLTQSEISIIDYDQKKLLNYLFFINKILDLTESEMRINIYFKNISYKFSEYEDVLKDIYLGILKGDSRFISDKEIIIIFPQLFRNKDFEIKNNENTYVLSQYPFQHKNNIIINNDVNTYKSNDYYNISETNNTESDIFKYNHIAFGGSFDHLHLGHYMLLQTAVLSSRSSIFIGITSDQMISKKCHKSYSQPFSIRKKRVLEYLNKINYNDCKIKINPLNDAIGGTDIKHHLEALILTDETLKGGILVNQAREKLGYKHLDFVLASIINQGEIKISSTYKRNELFNFIDKEKFDYLFSNWVNLMTSLNVQEDIIIQYFSYLRDYYCQNWRKYHTLKHIYNFIHSANNIKNKFNDFSTVLLSIWFHDIIYIPTRTDNEDRSVEFFKNFYEDAKLSELVDRSKVEKYIMCTKYHFKDIIYDDNDLNLFLDIDLESFGIISFEEYINNGIMYEYTHHYNLKEYIEGRTKFLQSLLKKDFIYRSIEFKDKLEIIARENIGKEIEYLEKQI